MDPAPVNAAGQWIERIAPWVLILLLILWAVWFVMWLVMPFVIYGMGNRLRDLLAAQLETNRLLRVLTQRDGTPGQREESEATRNPFK